jgi:hypothetical protein
MLQIDQGWLIGIVITMVSSLVGTIGYMNRRSDEVVTKLWEARVKDKDAEIEFWKQMVYDLLTTTRTSVEAAGAAADVMERGLLPPSQQRRR